MQICGGPGLEDCSGCGGALCGLALGKRKCGGPNCDGVVPVIQKASETAERVKDQLNTLPSRLQESKNKAGLHWDDWDDWCWYCNRLKGPVNCKFKVSFRGELGQQ